ncbi:MAG: hypothetical protein ACLUOF_02140 [Ruminococcus sp.]
MGKSVWLSVFHSISAFNNAGFDLLGGSVFRTTGTMSLCCC